MENRKTKKPASPQKAEEASLQDTMPQEAMYSAGGAEMPAGSMNAEIGGMDLGSSGAMGSSDTMTSSGTMGGGATGAAMAGNTGGGSVQVLVEMRVSSVQPLAPATGLAAASGLGFRADPEYVPIPMAPSSEPGASSLAADEQTIIVRGTIEADQLAALEQQPDVIKVWLDTPIAHFDLVMDTEEVAAPSVQPSMSPFGTCPIGTCDCASGTPKGTIADVANYLGVNQIWALGHRGEGIVVGVVDGGITAAGRPISSGDTSNPSWPNKLIPNVIGGFPTANWGTTGAAWGWHGNMCSTDVLGMAPNARVYDIRISDGSSIGSTISAALAGFQWAIDRHRIDGTPQILTNSWGIFQESWDPAYARDPNHPFTRKVVEALNEGILVLFAAGNCGGTCPDGRCSSDNGPGKSIWGANSHPRVITVGAVNKNEQFVGYSSQGPGALDPRKPDFCSITHFTGFFNSDSGTSAATPIAAGVAALLKQASPGLTQDGLKTAIQSTAKDIGPAGWDQHSGAGILRAKAAYDTAATAPLSSGPVVAWGPNRLDAFVIGTDSSLYHKWWNGSAWGPSLTGYEFMSGKILGSSEVVAWGPNRLDAFVVGTDSQLYHKWWNGSAWGPSVTGYEAMGGTIQDHPRAVAWGPNRLDVFVVGMDHSLYHKWWNGSAWGPSLTGYEFMSGKILGSPEAVAWGPNRLDVFVVGTDSQLYHKWWNGSAWGPSVTGYEAMGGAIQGHPRAVAWGPNRLDVFVVGMDHSLYHKWWNGSAWGPSLTGYEFMGGKILGSPEVVAWGPNRLDVFVVGTDHALYHKWWNGTSWGPSLTGYEFMGGALTGRPRVVSWAPNRLDVFAVGVDSALYHKWWNGSAWGPSLTGWENLGGVITEF